jgi:hypothetical protein
MYCGVWLTIRAGKMTCDKEKSRDKYVSWMSGKSTFLWKLQSMQMQHQNAMLNATKSSCMTHILHPLPISVHLHVCIFPALMSLVHGTHALNPPEQGRQKEHNDPAKVDNMHRPPPVLHTNTTARKLKDPFPMLTLFVIKIRRQEACVARVVAHHAA